MSKADWARERQEAIRKGETINLADWSFGAERPQATGNQEAKHTPWLSDTPDMTDEEWAEAQRKANLWKQAPDRNTDEAAWERWTDAHAKELGL